jgi:2-dehydro-3-deoxygluconokinase
VKYDLIGLGECMIELSATQPLAQARNLRKSYGGDVMNTLVQAARLGSRTGFISRVGDDPFGAGLRREWESEGIDASQAPLVEGLNGVYFISLLTNGEREFCYYRANSAASQLQPADLNAEFIASGRCLLISGITQAISEGAEATTLEAARIAKQHGLRVAFDPNYRARLWAARGGLNAARAATKSVLPLVDILLPSGPADFEVFDLKSDLDVLELAPIVALKIGAEGVWIRDETRRVQVPAEPVTVVDTTGAGDAWNAGFLHHLLRGATPTAAAQAGNLQAAKVVQAYGAIPEG